MARIYGDNSLAIGGTPLVRLARLAGGAGATVLGKVEARNPAYSVKCRIGASMIWDAEKRGALRPGMELVEPTSGNTGIALAFVAAARGYKLTIAMPSNYSVERRRVLKLLGADLELTPEEDGMYGAVERAQALVEESPGRFLMLQQFQNPANPRIHFETTGPEIWDDHRRRSGRARLRDRHRRHDQRRGPLLQEAAQQARALRGRGARVQPP